MTNFVPPAPKHRLLSWEVPFGRGEEGPPSSPYYTYYDDKWEKFTGGEEKREGERRRKGANGGLLYSERELHLHISFSSSLFRERVVCVRAAKKVSLWLRDSREQASLQRFLRGDKEVFFGGGH